MRQANRRIRLLVAVFALIFVAAFGRVAWLQAVKAQALDRIATSQHREERTVPARRGTIYDRLGRQLAIGERATTVYANPQQIVDARAAAIVAGRALEIEPDDLYPLLSDRSRGFVYLARKANPEKAADLKRQEIAGIGFYPEERRVYPQRTVASEVVGYAGTENTGLSGLELQFDKALAGHDGSETVVRDPFGRRIDVVDATPAQNGRDVHLTVDHSLQRQVEKILKPDPWRLVRKGGDGRRARREERRDPRARRRARLRRERVSGRVAWDEDRLRNRAVTDTYEPGSTFKVVTVGGVLEEGIVSPSTKFRLPCSIQVADRVIHDAVHARDADDDRLPDPLAVLQRRRRSRSRSSSSGRSSREWIKRFGFGAQDRCRLSG